MNSYVIDRQKWATHDIFYQMGNISSEVGRAIKAKKRGDERAFRAAISRGLDLFDATAEALAQSNPARLKEVLRAEEQFLSLFYGNLNDDKAKQDLEKYFFQFALAARRNH